MPRSVLLGRPWPVPGEPLFLPEDTRGALELQADLDSRCPSGHPLEDTVGEDAAAWEAHSFTCDACAAVDSARRRAQKEAQSYGEAGDDLLDGHYWTAAPSTAEQD